MCRRLLAENDQELSRELLSLGVVQNLLYTMGNREHIDAQIQSSLALEVHVFLNMQFANTHTQSRVPSRDSPLCIMVIFTTLCQTSCSQREL